MRWQVSLQLAIGLGALFGLAYYGVERFIGPPLESAALESADAQAVVGASEIASAWDRTRSGRRALVRALAGSPTFREGSSELIEAALESAAVQMGGGSAALLRANGEKIAAYGEPRELASLQATGDASKGVAIVRFEKIDGGFFAVSAAPVPEGRVLVLASKIEEPELRLWIRGLSDDVSVALMDGNEIVASTVVPGLKKSITAPIGDELTVQGTRFRTARRTLTDDVGTKLTVVGLASIAPIGTSQVVSRAQLFVLSLGALALVLVLIVVMLAPSESVRELIEEFNQASRDLPRTGPAPIEAIELQPEPSLEPSQPYFSTPPPQRARDRIPDTPPLATPTPSFSSPVLEAVTQPSVKRDRPSSDTRLALDAEQKIKPPPPSRSAPVVPPPSRSSPIVPPPSRSSPGSPFGSPDPIPLPGNAPPPSRGTIPPSSPFDQIAAAAFAPPPVVQQAPPPSMQRRGPKEDDLLMPKGVDLDAIAREAAKQGPPKFEPSDLPGLRSPFSGSTPMPPPSMSSSGISPMPQRSISQPREDLPGLRANDPAARAFDRTPSNPTNPGARKSSDPWSNPALGIYSTTAPPVQDRLSVPDRLPSNPPKQAPIPLPSSGPVAYDEEHYRVVYNEFVSSKARLGEAVDNITYEGFRSKLRSSEEALINRHGCRAVRFQVLVKDNTVSLRPQLVR